MAPEPLPAGDLYRRSDLAALGFRTTAELADVETLVGQDRALDAVRFAARMRARGYNLFVIGAKASGKHAAVRSYLSERAATFPAPDDWVYVNDFKDQHRPRCLRLPPGDGPALAARIQGLVAVPASGIAAHQSDFVAAPRPGVGQGRGHTLGAAAVHGTDEKQAPHLS